jgi:MFS-type transporter involved in bile tolerance (Atg22 family)
MLSLLTRVRAGEMMKYDGLFEFLNLGFFLGMTILISITGSFWIGQQLDQYFGYENIFTIICIIIGSIIGFGVVFRRLRQIGVNKRKEG